MKQLLQTLFFFLLVTQICFAQWNEQSSDNVETAWVQHYGSEKVASSDQASSLTLDAVGNLYVTGMSGGDIVTIKYNADGDTVWTRRYDALGSYGQWLPCSVVVDHLGNVYVAGGTDTYFGDFLTIKYSAEGSILWVRTYNGPADGGDFAMDIVVDEELNVYVIGARMIYEGQWQAHKPYIIKYDEFGNVSWQEEIESNLSGIKNVVIALDTDENIVLMEFSRTLKLDRNTGNIIWLQQYYPSYSWNQCLAVDQIGNVYINKAVEQPAYNLKYVTIKYYSNGTLAWLVNHNGPGRDWDATSAIAVDSIGNVYVTGTSGGKYITRKFDEDGNIVWSKNYIGPGNGGGRACAIAVDDGGNVYVTGSDQDDFATIKYDSNGNVLWVQRYDGLGHNTDNAAALILDPNGFVYVTGGSIGETSDFDYTTMKYSTNGDISWVNQFDGIPNSSDYATALAVDLTGNAYLTGRSKSTTTGDDYATVKYNVSGDLVWASRYAGSIGKEDRASSIAVDFDRNVYVTGKSEDSDTSTSYATIKYSSNGSLLWLQGFSSSSGIWDGTASLALDADGQVYVTGSSENDNVTLKYSAVGDTVWTGRHHFPGELYEATSMAVDGSGNAYVTGWAGIGGWWSRSSTRDYATIKYDTNGDTVWARLYNNEVDGWDVATSIAVDAVGNVYVTGSSDGSETGSDYATLKYSPDGDTLWVRRYDGVANGYDVAKSLSLDPNGNLFVTGVSEGLDAGWDFTTIKYNTDGDILWLRRYSRPGNRSEDPVSLTVDANGSVYIAGSSAGSSSDRDIVTIKYTSTGDEEWFARYDAAEKLNWPYSDDYATAIEVSPIGDVYVAGYSENSQQGLSEYTLIKYIQNPTNIENNYAMKRKTFELVQNYPNPFNPSTKIKYSVPQLSLVQIKVYDVLGNEIETLVNEEKQTGTYVLTWNAENLPSGVYFYQLRAGSFVETKKMLLLK